MTVNITRRTLLKTVPLAAGATSLPLFVNAAEKAAETKAWTGYAICDSCNHVPSCGIKFHAVGNVVQTIENWKENPNHWLCPKGLSTLQRLYNPNRLLYPMKRTNPKGSADPGWVRITWDEAYKTIASKMLETRKKYGADAVMFYTGDPKEPRPPIQRLARYFGSTTWCTESSVGCRSGCMLAEQMTFGQPNNGGLSKDTKVHMVLATNVWAKPAKWMQGLRAAKARGCKIIVVDARRTKTAEEADIHLQPRVGTDAALAMGMAAVLIREGLYNKEFVQKWTHGFEPYAEYAKQFTPEKTEELTGVPAKLVVDAARMWSQGPGSFTLTSQSLSHNSNGVNNTRALLDLAVLMGYIDIPGGVPFTKGPKGLRLSAYGLHPKMADDAWWNDRAQLERRFDAKELPLWTKLQQQVSPNNLPEWMKTKKVRMMCAWGFNVNIWPQPDVYAKAIEQIDFSFAADYFYRPDSHRLVDIILPAAMNYERYAPFGLYGRNIAVRTPVKPLGEAKEDWRIALELGCIVDTPEHFFSGDPVKACDFVLGEYGESWAHAEAALPKVTALAAPKPAYRKYETGGLRRDGKPGFSTSTGKLEFFSEIAAASGYEWLAVYKPMMPLEGEYNLRFINGTRKPYITHSKTRTDQPYLMEIEDRLTIDISPEDAAKRGIKTGDDVILRSRYGGPVEARANVSIIVPPGTIGGQYGWLGKGNTQRLVPRTHRDPESGYPCYFETPVSVVKKA
ncbi:MAG: 4Fe-4S Mo/W bis-MGD-type domain-containing protein [Burkholderia sp.]|jgi:anaerobic selenocysteine-containing dehydrogenase